jgi:hypothetical protein
MKKYVGQRPLDDEIGDCKVFVIDTATGQSQPLRHVVHHSPAGLEWGYGGSGPADLALSILADYFGEQPTKDELYRGECKCWPPHQPFKWAFIGPADRAGFELTEAQIADWLQARQA